jgi:hypothetical protein
MKAAAVVVLTFNFAGTSGDQDAPANNPWNISRFNQPAEEAK